MRALRGLGISELEGHPPPEAQAPFPSPICASPEARTRTNHIYAPALQLSHWKSPLSGPESSSPLCAVRPLHSYSFRSSSSCFLTLFHFTLRAAPTKCLPTQSLCHSRTFSPLGLGPSISAKSSRLKRSATKWPPATPSCIPVWGPGSVLPEGRSLQLQQIGITPISNILFDEIRCQQILPM